MNLAARRSARLKEKLVMRLGCFLVLLAVLASLILEPPRAKAFAVTSSAVTALAGAYLNACGLAPVVSGMSSSEEVNESLARLIQEYLDTDLPGTPLTDWLGNLSNLSLIHDRQWMLLLPTQAAASLHLFAAWVAGKYGTKPGVNQVYYVADSHVILRDGRVLYFSKFEQIGSNRPVVTAIGSVFNSGTDFPVIFPTGYSFGLDSERGTYSVGFFTPEGKFISGNWFSEPVDFIFLLDDVGRLWVYRRNSEGIFGYCSMV